MRLDSTRPPIEADRVRSNSFAPREQEPPGIGRDTLPARPEHAGEPNRPAPGDGARGHEDRPGRLLEMPPGGRTALV